MQCGACEAPKPGISKADLDKKKKDLANLFTGGITLSSKKSPFGASSSSGPTKSIFGAPRSDAAPAHSIFGAPRADAVSAPSIFGAPRSDVDTVTFGPTSPTGSSKFGASASSSKPVGFVYVPKTVVDENIEHAEKNKKSLTIAESVPTHGTLTCDVFVNGSGECEQLGLGDDVLEKKKPAWIKTLKEVTQISVGCLHTLALTANGKIFSWGCNDDGCLGRQGAENEPLPVDFKGVAVKLTAGGCHSAAIDIDGGVWCWGSYKDCNGYIGFPDFTDSKRQRSIKSEKTFIPTKVPEIQRATQISSGVHHTVCLAGGSAFSWGDDSCAQLGQATRTPEQPAASGDDAKDKRNLKEFKLSKISKLFPRRLVLPRADLEVKIIGTGSDYTFRVAKSEETYACGLNGDYQLGIGTNSEAEREFRLIDGLKGNEIAEISGGTSHSVARTIDSRIFVWGRSDRCGKNQAVGHIRRPSELPKLSFAGREVVSVFAARGGTHTVAVTNAGDLYTWGSGDVQQLANVPKDVNDFTPEEKELDIGPDELTPYLVTSKGLADRFVLRAEGGSQHTAAIAWDKTGPRDTKKRPLPMDGKVAQRKAKAVKIEAH